MSNQASKTRSLFDLGEDLIKEMKLRCRTGLRVEVYGYVLKIWPIGQASQSDELKRLRDLLAVARCPNGNCNGGAIVHLSAGGEPDLEQCQWCYERTASCSETVDTAHPWHPITEPCDICKTPRGAPETILNVGEKE